MPSRRRFSYHTAAIRVVGLLFGGAMAGAATPAPVAAPPTLSATTNPWQQLARQDVDAMTAAIRSSYIYALVPPDPAWSSHFAAARARAAADTLRVASFAGYQAVLRRYADAFSDAHLGVRFAIDQSSVNWPQFLVRYRAGHYVVVGSTLPALHDGAIVDGCDGQSMAALVEKVTPEAGRLGFADSRTPGIEATRASMAGALFVDVGSPFYARPARCTFDGTATDLEWRPIATAQLARVGEGQGVAADRNTGFTTFGGNAAWVHLGTFNPATAQEKAQWHALIDAAATLRGKDLIVFDVRGNSGGPYNWFMALLEALYGSDYTDYYARARLSIRPVMLADDPKERAGILAGVNGGHAEGDPTLPDDRNLDYAVSKATTSQVNGHALITLEPRAAWPAPARRPAQSIVKGKVFVLTDYGCQSACIAFVDEMRRFPGVTQVGGETGVDSRSGTPKPFPLPSGAATLYLPSMTRLDRVRDDNVPWQPQVRYDGNIADTAAVRAWIEQLPH